MNTTDVRLVVTLAAAALAIGGCASMPRVPRLTWPWSAKQAPPEAVQELEIADAVGAPGSLPQYWDRNTLIVDLQSVAAAGSVVLKPRAGGGWPRRLAFRVAAGGFDALEVRGDQRVLIPIGGPIDGPATGPAGASPGSGRAVLELPLVAGVYGPNPPQLALRWGATTATGPQLQSDPIAW